MSRLDRLSGASGTLIVAAVALGAEGAREMAMGGDFRPIAVIGGPDAPIAAIAVAAAGIAGAAGGHAARRAFAAALLFFAAALSPLPLAFGFAAAGAVAALRVAVLLNRRAMGESGDDAEDPSWWIAGVVAGYAAATLSPVSVIRAAAVAVGVRAAWDAIGAGSRGLLEWYRRVMNEVPAVERPAGTEERRSERRSGPFPANLSDEQIRICMGIVEFITENFARDGWSAPEIDEVFPGPMFTTYTLRTPPTFSSSKFTARPADLAMHLRLNENQLVLRSGTEFGVIVQVTNRERSILWIDELIDSDGRLLSRRPFAALLGRDAFNKPVYADIAGPEPHILIGGTTGSGKSIALHSILIQLLDRNGPADFQLAFIDMKQVTAPLYEDLPHLWQGGVAVEPGEAKSMITTVREEMDRRYKLLRGRRMTNVSDWNREFPNERIPVLLLVIDEVASLTELADDTLKLKEHYEREAGLIATKGRAAGVFLAVGVQRPTIKNVGENVRGMLNQRIALKAGSANESGVIMGDQKDDSAMRLGGQGDGFYIIQGRPRRFAGAFIPETPSMADDRGRPDYSVPAELRRIGVKWVGAPRPTYDPTPASADGAAVDRGAAKAAVAARHRPEVSDVDWLTIEAMDALTREAADPYADTFDVTGDSLYPVVESVAGDYPFEPPLLPSDVARSLERLLGRGVNGKAQWVVRRANIVHPTFGFIVQYGRKPAPGEAPAAPAAKERQAGPDLDELMGRTGGEGPGA